MVDEFVEKYPQQEFFPLELDFLAKDESIKKLFQVYFLKCCYFTQGITNYQFLSSQNLEQIENVIRINLLTPIKNHIASRITTFKS